MDLTLNHRRKILIPDPSGLVFTRKLLSPVKSVTLKDGQGGFKLASRLMCSWGSHNGIGSWIPLWEGWGRLERVHHIIWGPEKSESDYGLGLHSSHMIQELQFDCLVHVASLLGNLLSLGSGGHLCINLVPSVLGDLTELLHFFHLKTSLQFCQFKFFQVFVSKEPYYHPGSSLPKNGALQKGADLTLSEACPWPAQSPVFIDLVHLNKLLPFPPTTLQ